MKVDSGIVSTRATVFDTVDNPVIVGTASDVPSDGAYHTYVAHFDVSSISRPTFVNVAVEVNAQAPTGEQRYIEFRWW